MDWITARDVLINHGEILGDRRRLRSNHNKSRRELWCVAMCCSLRGRELLKIKSSDDLSDSVDVFVKIDNSSTYGFQVIEATSGEYQEFLYESDDALGDGYPENPSLFVGELRKAIRKKEEKSYSNSSSLNLIIYFNLRIVPLSENEREISLRVISSEFSSSPFLSISVLWDTEEFGPKMDIIKGVYVF